MAFKFLWLIDQPSSLALKVTDLLSAAPGDNEVTTSLIHHTTTMSPDTKMDTPTTLPKLCINGVEVNLTEPPPPPPTWANIAASPPQRGLKSAGPVAVTTPNTSEGDVPSIFGPQLAYLPLLTPPLSPGVVASSISPVAAIVSTAPVEAQGLITPIFGSETSSIHGMFYTPVSIVPCKREGSPLEKDQEQRTPPQLTTGYFDDIIETSYTGLTPPNSPTLTEVVPVKSVVANVVSSPGEFASLETKNDTTASITKYHEYDFRSRKSKSVSSRDYEFLLEHSPHSIRRTPEDQKAVLHPGRILKFKAPRKQTPTPVTRPNSLKDAKTRRGTPLIALIRSLATVPHDAFDSTGKLRREWLHEARPQLFHKGGVIQEYVKIKDRPCAMPFHFFSWLRGDDVDRNIYTKADVEWIVRVVMRETAVMERFAER
jgi:hypothetical protein